MTEQAARIDYYCCCFEQTDYSPFFVRRDLARASGRTHFASCLLVAAQRETSFQYLPSAVVTMLVARMVISLLH